MKKINRINKQIVLVLLLIATANLYGSGIKRPNLKKIDMAMLMANSQMQRYPVPGISEPKAPAWHYVNGFVSFAMLRLWKETGDEKYYQYVKDFADACIDENGSLGFNLGYTVNHIQMGSILFDLYRRTSDERYKKVILATREVLKTYPRTKEGDFWVMEYYPNQVWLDDLYMICPFYAMYAGEFNEPGIFDDVAKQFVNIHKHTYDPETGLNYHGWDETKQLKWADPTTGRSPCIWGRAMGWYAMALVEVLEVMPESHPGRPALTGILQQVAAGIKKSQDKKSGVWYQVLDQGGREGNYLEASVSGMFVYTLLKASRLGYIDKAFKKVAVKGFEGMKKQFIRHNDNGTINLTSICRVAGLGKDDKAGTYEYYINEKIVDDDGKGVGAFILAGIEMGY
jgi:unsaturated rhamnogalacturonyl hydrolase